MKHLILALLTCMVLSSCHESIIDTPFDNILGERLPLTDYAGSAGLAMVFITPECPLCQNYTRTLNIAHRENEAKGIEVIGVISGTYVSKEEIEAFTKTYETTFPIVLDPDFKLAKNYRATITPEVIFLDSLNDVRYQGAIDNWAISLGQKRLKITAHYMNDAFESYLSGNKIEVPYTKAIGCYIE